LSTHIKEYRTLRSPTITQQAKDLVEAARAGYSELYILRGESGCTFKRNGGGWEVDSHGNTITNPEGAAKRANAQLVLEGLAKPHL